MPATIAISQDQCAKNSHVVASKRFPPGFVGPCPSPSPFSVMIISQLSQNSSLQSNEKFARNKIQSSAVFLFLLRAAALLTGALRVGGFK